MKTEYRTYTIEPDHRNPYAQKPEWMYYPTEQGIQHDADQDGEYLKYCGNCEWADTLEEAQIAIDDLIIDEQGERIEALEKALEAIMGHIDSGYLVRDISKDHESDWAIKQLPFLADLQNAQQLVKTKTL